MKPSTVATPSPAPAPRRRRRWRRLLWTSAVIVVLLGVLTGVFA